MADLGKSVKTETATEVTGFNQAAQARQADVQGIKNETDALRTMGLAAERSNVQTLYGGRSSMGQHLSDMQQELQYQRYLNIAQWLGFTTPQQAYAWRQNEYSQRLLMNRAEFAGYATADQFISFLQKEVSGNRDLNTVMLQRAALYKAETDAALGYTNALGGTHASIGQLGEGLLPGAQQFAAALAGLPAEVTTQLQIDDTDAMARLMAWEAVLRGVPREISTADVITAAYVAGGVPLPSGLQDPEVIPVSFGGPYQEQFAAILAEIARLDQMRAEIPVHFDLPSEAVLAAFISHIPVAGITVPVTLVSEGGGAGGGGGPPPVLAAGADEPPDDAAAKWAALDAAEMAAGASAATAAAELRAMAVAAGSAADSAKLMYAAGVAESIAASKLSAEAKDNATQLILQSAAADRVSDSSKLAYSAALALGAAERTSGAGAVEAMAGLAALEGVTNNLAGSASRAAGRWRVLTDQVTLWAGFLGSTAMIGEVAIWHIALDGVIEVLALWIPALVTAGVALAAWAAAGYQSAKQVALQMYNVYQVSKALNTVVPPLTDGFQKMANAVRPQVYELFGDALDVMSSKSGVFNTLIQQTGDYLDTLAARIVVALKSGGGGFTSFLEVGEKDLALIGQGFDSLGTILMRFLKATELTHIAEDLAAIGDAILKVSAAIVSIIPTPVLALLLGFHGLVLWGGLMASAVGKVLIGVDALIGRFPMLNGVALTVAEALGATDSKLVSIAAHGPAVAAVMDVLGSTTTKNELAQLSVQVDKAGMSMTQYVESMGPNATAKLESFSVGLSAAQKETVALALASGASTEQLAKIGSTAESVGTDAEESAGKTGLLASAWGVLAAVPVVGWIALAAAAVGALTVIIVRAKDATQGWITGMDTALAKTSAYTAIGQTISDLAAVTKNLAIAQQTGTGNANELSSAQSDLSGKLSDELVHVGGLSKAYGVGLVGALELVNIAGVSTSALFSGQAKVWAVAEAQIQGVVTGYKAMGQQMGTIGSDLNVLSVSESTQLKNMANLNTAWDDWTKIVAGAPNAFILLAQGMNTFNTDAKAAGASMTGLSAPSLTLQFDFQSSYSAVESLFDAMRSSEALTGAGGFTAFVKDAVASLLPMAAGSKEALAQVSALAQEAGGPATTSLSALTRWVGGIKDPLGAMYAASARAAEATSNLNQDAARLATTLQQDVDPAMATAAFNAYGGQQAFSAFATDLAKFGPGSATTVTAGRNVAQELLSIDKNSASARSQFVGWAESMGLSATAAGALWTEVSKGEKPLGAVRDSLAGGTDAGKAFVQSGFWGQVRDKFSQLGDFIKAHPIASLVAGEFNFIPGVTAGLDKAGKAITDFFAKTVPDAAGKMVSWFTTSLPHAWDTAYQSFFADFASPMVGWFTTSLPHGIEAGWDKAWSGLVSPVMHVFDEVKTAISTGFDQWWAGHGREVEQVWNGVTTFIEHNWDNVWGGVKATFAGVLVAFDVFTGGLEGAWDTLIGWFKGQGDVGKVLKPMWDGLVGAVLVVVGTIEGIFRVAWGVIALGAKVAWAAIAATGKTAWDLMMAVFKTAWDALMAVIKIAWAGAIDTLKVAWDVFVGVINVALDLLTGHWSKAWADMKAAAEQVWNALKAEFDADWKASLAFLTQLWNNFSTFFVQLWNNALGFLKSAWDSFWGWFKSVIIGNFSNFFTRTIPSWFGQFVTEARNAWDSAWGSFRNTVISGMTTFFTQTIPRWWGEFVSGGRNAMSQVASGLEGGFKTAVNWVISNVINRVIGLINDVTGVVGVPKIKGIGLLAEGGAVHQASGSVAGTGDEDGTHIIAMGGEYMLRKPARMALQAAYGPGFLPLLNQADSWLGSGSRGNFASQGRPMAAGGMAPQGFVAPLGGHAASFHAGAHMASGGQIVAEAEKFVGAPYVYGGTSPEGWDCSGFTKYVLDQEGFNPPRTSEAQYAWSHHVAQSQLLPGNLVFAQFPGDNASPGHVGFYVGGDNVLSAEDPQLGTGYSSLSSWGGSIVGYGAEPGPGLLGQIGSFIGGIGGELWQSVEGLLNAAGDALSGNLAPLAKYVSGGASELLKLAKEGAEAVFNAIWSSTIQPLVNNVVPGGDQSAVGGILEYAAASLKAGIDGVLGAKDAAAKSSSSAGGGGPATAGRMTPQQIATLWVQDGGAGSAAANMARIAMAESGDDPSIVQKGEPPGLTGWGLYQITPTSGITQGGRFGNLLNASNNTKAAISLYNSSGYGPWTSDPVGSALVQGGITYAGGGPVGMAAGNEVPVPWLAGLAAGNAHNTLTAAGLVPTAAAGQKAAWFSTGSSPSGDTRVAPDSRVAIQASSGAKSTALRVPDLAGFTAGVAHNILVAMGLTPVAAAGQKAYWKVTGSSPGKGVTVNRGARVTIQASAAKVPVPNLVGYQAGPAHNALVAAGLVPVAAAGQRAYWFVTGTTPKAGTMVEPGSRVTILASVSATGRTGAAAAANWPAAQAALGPARTAQANAFWNYIGATLPKGGTTADWEHDYSDRLILAWQQNNLYGDYQRISGGLANPISLSDADWSDLESAVSTQKDWMAGTPNPPSDVWHVEKTGGPGLKANWPKGYKPGTYAPQAAYRRSKESGLWNTANATATELADDVATAAAAWTTLFGPQGTISTSAPTPGLQVIPSGGGPVTINLEPLVPGGPASPVFDVTGGSSSSSGSGFSGGGTVGLADVAGQFAFGGLIPGLMPRMQPGMASNVAADMAENPRTVSSAASSSGDRVGVKVGNITIHNAIAEKPSDSITRSSNRLAFLAGRGPVLGGDLVPAASAFAYLPGEAWLWNGLALNQSWFNISTFGGSRSGIPVLRGSNYAVPYRAGQSWRPKYPDQRTITLTMWLDGSGSANHAYPAADPRLAFNDNWSLLRKSFWTRGASTGSVQGQLTRNWYLTAGGPGLVTATAMAEIAGSMDLTMNGRTSAAFSVDLLLADPYFYGSLLTQTITTAGGSITNPAEGTAGESWPSAVSAFTVVCSAATTVANSTAGVSFTISSGPTFPVTVDILNMTVVDNAGANRIANLTHAGSRLWMALLPGANSITNSAGTAIFAYNPPWI